MYSNQDINQEDLSLELDPEPTTSTTPISTSTSTTPISISTPISTPIPSHQELYNMIKSLEQRVNVLESLNVPESEKTITTSTTTPTTTSPPIPSFKVDYNGGGPCQKCGKRLWKQPAFFHMVDDNWKIWCATPKCCPFTSSANTPAMTKFREYWNTTTKGQK